MNSHRKISHNVKGGTGEVEKRRPPEYIPVNTHFCLKLSPNKEMSIEMPNITPTAGYRTNEEDVEFEMDPVSEFCSAKWIVDK